MKSIIKKEDLEKAKNNEQIIRETAEQIIKDFMLFGLEITFSGNLNMIYDELFNQMEYQVNELIVKDYTKLLSLLYQIDLSEKFLNKNNLPTQYESEAAFISNLIIQRELVKVLSTAIDKTPAISLFADELARLAHVSLLNSNLIACAGVAWSGERTWSYEGQGPWAGSKPASCARVWLSCFSPFPHRYRCASAPSFTLF